MQLQHADRAYAEHGSLGNYLFGWEGEAEALFTENESNAQRLWNQPNPTPFVKDAFHEYVVGGRTAAVNPNHVGTKCAPHFRLHARRRRNANAQMRLVREQEAPEQFFGKAFDKSLPIANRRQMRFTTHSRGMT
jgi:hypothetical protein